MNIAITATIAQVSLPSAAPADSSASSPSSVASSGGTGGAGQLTPPGSGSSFDDVLGSATGSQSATDTAAPEPPNAPSSGQQQTQSASSNSAADDTDNSTDSLTSDQHPAIQKRKTSSTAGDPDSQAPTPTDPSAISPTVVFSSTDLTNSNPATVTRLSPGSQAGTNTSSPSNGSTSSANSNATSSAVGVPPQAVSVSSGSPNAVTLTASSIPTSTVAAAIPGKWPSAAVAGSETIGMAAGLGNSPVTSDRPGQQANLNGNKANGSTSISPGAIAETGATNSSPVAEVATSVGESGTSTAAAAAIKNAVSAPQSGSNNVVQSGGVNQSHSSNVTGLRTSNDGLSSASDSQGLSVDPVNSPSSLTQALNQVITGNASSNSIYSTVATATGIAGDPQMSPGATKKPSAAVNSHTGGLANAGQSSASSNVASTIVPTTAESSSTSTTTGTTSITSQLADSVIQQVQSQSNGEQSSVVLRLNPPELGQVNVHVSMTDNVVAVHMVASNAATQQIIDGQMGDLRQSLSNQGLTLSQSQVDSNLGSQMSFAGGQQSFDQSAAQQSYSNSASYASSLRQTIAFPQQAVSQSGSTTQLNYVA